jgi:aryl-alcohol dehydrogenase-like predicted oxidoreductase
VNRLVINTSQSGTFTVGGDITVNRLGFGAMRITGPGIWGPPSDVAESLQLLKRLPEIGINFIDTADSYGPEVSENLLREALHPYTGLLIATKGGLTRGGPDQWTANGRPEYLRQAVTNSLKRLKIDRIDLWQLHRIDSRVPQEEQFDVIRNMQQEGLIRHVGLSEVRVSQIKAAQHYFNVATVQNRYNLADRHSEEVLAYCTKNNIGFIPWYPLAAGSLATPNSIVHAVAKKLNATPSQIALAWALKKSPVILPIPGTSKLRHLEENVAAASITLSVEDFQTLDDTNKT